MTERRYSSTAGAYTLNSSVSDSVTSINISSTAGLPTAYPFTLVLDPGTVSEEIVTVTNASGTALTVTRGEDGSAAQSHTAGAVVRHMATARDFREPQQHIESSVAHGRTSALVGATDAQTIQNKTLDASNVIAQGAVTGLTTALGNTVNLTGDQTVGGAKTFSGTVSFSNAITAPNVGVTAIYRKQISSWGSTAVNRVTLQALPSLGTGVAYDVEIDLTFSTAFPGTSPTLKLTQPSSTSPATWSPVTGGPTAGQGYQLPSGANGTISTYTSVPVTGACDVAVTWGGSAAIPSSVVDLVVRVYRI